MVAGDLDKHWEQVRKGLDAIRERHHEPWHPSDVYKSIVEGHSFLFMLDDGFVILQRHVNFGVTELFVWILYAPHAFESEDSAATQTLWTELETMARKIGARQIVMRSRRKGWARVMQIREYIYTHDV